MHSAHFGHVYLIYFIHTAENLHFMQKYWRSPGQVVSAPATPPQTHLSITLRWSAASGVCVWLINNSLTIDFAGSCISRSDRVWSTWSDTPVGSNSATYRIESEVQTSQNTFAHTHINFVCFVEVFKLPKKLLNKRNSRIKTINNNYINKSRLNKPDNYRLPLNIISFYNMQFIYNRKSHL